VGGKLLVKTKEGRDAKEHLLSIKKGGGGGEMGKDLECYQAVFGTHKKEKKFGSRSA